jgi:ribonucleotide reductase alpha subunit
MDLSGSSSDAGTNDMATLLDTAGVSPGESKSKGKRTPYPLDVDHSRDARLTDFGKATLDDRYLLPGESYQDLFVRVAIGLWRRSGARAAHLRLYQQALVHAGDARALERRHHARSADQLLPERGQ